jgi:hypothetical protein
MTDTMTQTPRATAARTLIRRLRGEHRTATAARPTQAAVHFHNGPQGAPAVCDDPRCASPRLEL